jgi:uncharacterized repeat protein (TIGR03843 family)
MSSHKRTPSTSAIAALTHGSLQLVGRLPWGSNYTFLVDVEHHGESSRAIYKPFQGEQPLWDFPEGIYRREVAAYRLSAELGWPNIPEMVVRDDAPFGVGSLQRFVPADFEQHYFTMIEDPDFDSAFKTIATFDVIVNNADRKAGHCLLAEDGEIFAIDNALCFNAEPKLRTVIWEFGGEPIEPALLDDLRRLRTDWRPDEFAGLLDPAEIDSLVSRIEALLANPVLPELVSERQYPWPLI